jgi:hypothetical protein
MNGDIAIIKWTLKIILSIHFHMTSCNLPVGVVVNLVVNRSRRQLLKMSSMHANSCLNECTYILLINSINFIGGCYVNFMSNWVSFTVYYDQIYLVLTSLSL